MPKRKRAPRSAAQTAATAANWALMQARGLRATAHSIFQAFPELRDELKPVIDKAVVSVEKAHAKKYPKQLKLRNVEFYHE